MPRSIDSGEWIQLDSLLSYAQSNDAAALLDNYPVAEPLRTLLGLVLANRTVVGALRTDLAALKIGFKSPTPAAGVLTVEITRVTVSGPRRNDAADIPFHVEPGGLIVLDGDTTSLDDGSVLNFDAGIRRDGVGILVDEANNPELLGAIRWEARALETGKLVGAIGGSGMYPWQPTPHPSYVDGDVHFLDPRPSKGEGMWRRSGGMSVTCAVRTQAVIYARIADSVDSRTTPEVR